MELKYSYTIDDGFYVGYLDDYPEYTTQGEDLSDFEQNLLDIYEMTQDGTLETSKRTKKHKGILQVAL
jgi:predicted RNase H-like HicB family nuclease